MSEIAQLFESALRNNRSTLLRQAAMRTIERMPHAITLRELMQSEAAAALRELTLDDLASVLEASDARGRAAPDGEGAPERPGRRLRIQPAPESADAGASGEGAGPDAVATREEAIYRHILDALAGQALTIGQLGRTLEIDTDELRGYLSWMKKMGKVGSTGRARATRYHVS